MHHLRYEIYKVAIIVKCKHKTLCDYYVFLVLVDHYFAYC